MTESDGPRVREVGADRLRSLLAEYSDALVSLGVPLDDWLAPGVSEHEVRSQLADVELVSSDELVVWFGWHDGLNPGVDRKRSTQALPGIVPLSLQEAVAMYRAGVLNVQDPPERPGQPKLTREDFFFGAGVGWLRIANDIYGPAVECVDPPSRIPRLRSPNIEFGFPGTEGYFGAVSMCTLVTWWVESLRSGAFDWLPKEQRWEIRPELFPASQRAARF